MDHCSLFDKLFLASYFWRQFGQNLGSERQLRTVKGAAPVISDGPCLSCAWNLCHCIESVVTCARIGTRDKTPFAAIPVLNEGLLDISAGEVVPNSPDIVLPESCDRAEEVVT